MVGRPGPRPNGQRWHTPPSMPWVPSSRCGTCARGPGRRSRRGGLQPLRHRVRATALRVQPVRGKAAAGAERDVDRAQAADARTNRKRREPSARRGGAGARPASRSPRGRGVARPGRPRRAWRPGHGRGRRCRVRAPRRSSPGGAAWRRPGRQRGGLSAGLTQGEAPGVRPPRDLFGHGHALARQARACWAAAGKAAAPSLPAMFGRSAAISGSRPRMTASRERPQAAPMHPKRCQRLCAPCCAASTG